MIKCEYCVCWYLHAPTVILGKVIKCHLSLSDVIDLGIIIDDDE